ncbi:site-specific integrase [Dietzia sp. WMMA184]|uniref:tyrosine-type recombinase/integrase n=1 Tax=Dietzia sp. WMMA184 TaxID=2039808 RepID=UPI000BDF5A8C|nr:site-specific integrase [Dietzia sp. WMMA184]
MTPRGFFRRLTRKITRWPLYIRQRHGCRRRSRPPSYTTLWGTTDVDLDGATIRVRHTVASVDGKLSLSDVKTAKSKRTVPLSPATVAMLRGRRPALLRERLAAGNQYTDNSLVFPTEVGTIVDPRNLLREVETAAARCGFEGVGVHTLRHSAAVAWLEAGVHIRAVADLLGHSSVSITGDVYGHTSEPVSRSAVEGLSDALGF